MTCDISQQNLHNPSFFVTLKSAGMKKIFEKD